MAKINPSSKKSFSSHLENDSQSISSNSTLFTYRAKVLTISKKAMNSVLGGIAKTVNFVAANNLLSSSDYRTVTKEKSSESSINRIKPTQEALQNTREKVKDSSRILSSKQRRRNRSMDNLWSLLRRNAKKIIGGTLEQLPASEHAWNEVLGVQIDSHKGRESLEIRPYDKFLESFYTLWKNNTLWKALGKLERKGEIEPVTNMSQLANLILSDSAYSKLERELEDNTAFQMSDARWELRSLITSGVGDVAFLSEKEKASCRIRVIQGEVVLENPLSTRGMGSKLHPRRFLENPYNPAIFIVGEDGQGYACSKARGNIQHTSLSGGKPVYTVGFIAKVGQRLFLTNNSGHYQPGMAELVKSLKYFQSAGVDVKNINVVDTGFFTGTEHIVSFGCPRQYLDSLSSLFSIWCDHNDEMVNLMKEFEGKSHEVKSILNQFGEKITESGQKEYTSRFNCYLRYSFDSFLELMDKNPHFASSLLKKMEGSPHLNDNVKKTLTWW